MKLAVGISGASGAIYASEFLKAATLLIKDNQIDEIGVVFSTNAKTVWKHELENTDYNLFDFPTYEKTDFNAPFASGSAGYDALVICPCSMGTLGRIAQGISNDLITRAADVMLKERKKLIAVVRETPLNLIQIENMQKVTQAGGIVCPATPSFYSKPQTVEDVADTVIHRVVDLLGLTLDSYRWGKTPKPVTSVQ